MNPQKILQWYTKNKRDLPWRKTKNPYHILVSEVMLQQTQVDRVIPKYSAFLNAFPTIQKLAKANKQHLLRLWSGLGYNRRALLLQKTAQQVTQRFNGKVPNNYDDLITLPGIGPYIANAVLIFAFNQDRATIDTNIRRILIHQKLATEDTPQSELFTIAKKIVPKGKSSLWHNALMDYGATILTARKTKIKPLTTQSKFKGSDRYYRGQIIKLLTKKKSIKISDLKKGFDKDTDFLKKIISTLEKDGFIKKTKNSIKIK